LNDYLTAMTDIIIEERGTVDKYEGDAIIAFWNAPLDVPDHGERAVRAALRCQEMLAELRPEFENRFHCLIKMRIGLNSGSAVVGNFGSHTKFDYTMLGDAVNLAARLEGTNKQFGTYTMISEFTRKLIGDGFFVREIGRVMVVGKKEPVTVYEPMGEKEFKNRKKALQSFDTGLRLFYEGRFQKARDVFSSLSERDPASESYLRYCEYLMEHPPGDGWQGIWQMESK
jgi:adenylate cyclase